MYQPKGESWQACLFKALVFKTLWPARLAFIPQTLTKGSLTSLSGINARLIWRSCTLGHCK